MFSDPDASTERDETTLAKGKCHRQLEELK